MAQQDFDVIIKVQADLKQAQAELRGLQTEIDQLRVSSVGVSSAGADFGASIANGATSATASVNKFAETEAQAAARIHEMVQAGIAQAEAQKAAAAATDTLAAAQAGSATAATASAEASRAVAASSVLNRAAVTAQIADFGILDSVLAGQVRTTEEVGVAEAALDRLQQAGVISTVELTAAFDALNKVTEKNTVANVENAVSRKGLNSRTTYSLSALVTDAATGQFSRSRREVAALANETGLFAKLMTPAGLAVGAFAAVVGTLAVAFVEGEKESEKFNGALISTGAIGTTTAGQLVDMANAVGASSRSYGNAIAALTQLTSTGKYTANQLQGLTQTAVDFASVTGGKVADGVKFVDGVMSGNIGTIQKLDEQYHFLSASQFDEIQRLIDQGQQEQATAIAQQAASQAVHARAQEVQDNAGIMIRAWHGVENAASAAWNAMKDVGATHSIGQQLKDAMASLEQAKGTHADRAGNLVQNASPEAIAALQNQITSLRAQLVTQGFEQTQKAVADNAETKSKLGLAALDKFKAPLEAFQDATAKAKKDLDYAMLGNLTADEIARAKEHYQQALDVAQKAYDSATKQHRGKSGANIDHAQLNADIAAVQNALALIQNAYQNSDKKLQALRESGQISDKAYYDGLRADLDKYVADKTAALEQEKTAATSHIKTQADRIAADQKVGKIDAEITQVQQDAATKRIQIDAQEKQSLEKSQQAWESLQRSFATPAEVRVEDALKQIQQLNKFLADGVINATQYHDALEKIGDKAIAPLPSYRGPGAAVGGPFGELQKNYEAQKTLDAAYNADLLALNDKFRDTDLAHETVYQAARAKLDAEYAANSTKIEQARQQLTLDTTANFFGQIATLSSSHNNRIAAIGKAAAIAQTVIKTYQSATEAYASLAGIPYIGPALGIAAAAAAVAAGLANVAQIRSQAVGGYATGGLIRGPGTSTSDSIPARLSVGEYVVNAAAVQQYGVDFLHGLNERRFADGGFVSPFANVPSPAQMGFASPTSPRVDFRSLAAANDSRGPAKLPPIKVVAVWDREQAAREVMNSETGQKVIVQTVANNPRAINGKWNS